MTKGQAQHLRAIAVRSAPPADRFEARIRNSLEAQGLIIQGYAGGARYPTLTEAGKAALAALPEEP